MGLHIVKYMLNFKKAGEILGNRMAIGGLIKLKYIFLMVENFQGKEERTTSPYVYHYMKQPSKVTGKLLKMSLTKIVMLFVLG